jgi:membrane protease YdiL (CAAX protease family)
MTTSEPADRPGVVREGLLARHPLLFFVLIAYLGTWVVWLPFLLSADGLGLMVFSNPLPLIVIGGLGTFTGPALGAFVMTGIIEGRVGIRRLVRKIVLWRVGVRWYLLTFLGFPVILTLATIVVPGNLASFEPMDPLPLLGSFLIFFVYPALIIGGPLGEEPGWRGFALPRLQRQHGPLVGSLILGVIWTFWHVAPVWLGAWLHAGMLNVYNFVLYLLFITSWTIVMTWVYNNTKGSVFMAILGHASVDAFPNGILWPLLPASLAVTGYGVYFGYYGMVIGMGVLALVVIALTRGQLGYQHYRQEEDEEVVVEEPDSVTATA